MTDVETLPFKRDEPKATAGLRASLKAPDLQKRRSELLDRFEREGDRDVQLEMAFLEYMVHDFDAGLATAQAAYRGLRQQGRKRRAALAAAAVGRIYFEGLNNQVAARGWFSRGRTLLADEGECVERGWVELGLVGCSVTDVGALATKAAEAVKLARKFDDLDLECKALADQGLALVTLGRSAEGMELIDEAMAILNSGEVHSFAAGQVACCTLTACERIGHLARAAARRRGLVEVGMSSPDKEAPRQIGEDHVRAVPLLALLANAEIARGDLDAARRAAETAEHLARETLSPGLIGEAALAMGNALAAAGNVTGAGAALDEGLRAVAPIEQVLIKVALHPALAPLLAESDAPMAITEARAALAIFERLDAPEAEVCATLLRRLGAKVSYSPRPPADPLAPLSRPHRQVVDLIAQVLTTSQITANLFI